MFPNLQPIKYLLKDSKSWKLPKSPNLFPPKHSELEESQRLTPITPTVSHGNKPTICVFLLHGGNRVSQWVHRGWHTSLAIVTESIWFISGEKKKKQSWNDLHRQLCRRSWWLTPGSSSHYTLWCPHVNTPPVTLPESGAPDWVPD